MKSVMSHKFSQVPSAQIQRSTFNRSHGTKTTFDGGYLIPIYLDEALPGDTFNLRMSAFARLATPLKPIMDNLHLETFFFAVPYRLLWENWEKFNGAQDNPADPVSFTVPQIVAPAFGAGGIVAGSLGDYMGLPVGALDAANTGVKFNSLHHRAYNLIWNQWFRDENLQDSVVVDVDNGPDTYTDYVLLQRGKRHDYFTSCLPWPLKGGSNVEISMGGEVDIEYHAFGDCSSAPFHLRKASDDTLIPSSNTSSDPNSHLEAAAGAADAFWDPDGRLYADLASATPITINELREAIQLQKMYERDARGGTRYTELVKSHFKVTSPDARLQRPEYLGGGSSPINITPVEANAEAGVQKVGDLTGKGVASFSGHGFSKSFTEHCILIGMVNVRADLTYQEGMNRMFSRRTRFDYFWPALAHLGEQAVLNKEIFTQGEGVAADEAVFGYQERNAEYRYKPSTITGQYRSNHGTPLDMWHLAQENAVLPTLSAAFIVDEPPIDRCIAVPSEPHILFDAYFDLKCARPMPVYGVPGQMDRF